MVKFIAQDTKDNVPLIGFGLSEKNIELLKNKQPIIIKGKEMNVPINFMIFYGKDEKTMYMEMEDFIGTETEIKNEMKKK